MAEYRVLVEEVLGRVVTVEAQGEEEALRAVEDMYRRGEVVLDESDFDGEATFSACD